MRNRDARDLRWKKAMLEAENSNIFVGANKKRACEDSVGRDGWNGLTYRFYRKTAGLMCRLCCAPQISLGRMPVKRGLMEELCVRKLKSM